MMRILNKDNKCSSANIKKIINNLLTQEEREEYVGVKLYYSNFAHKF